MKKIYINDQKSHIFYFWQFYNATIIIDERGCITVKDLFSLCGTPVTAFQNSLPRLNYVRLSAVIHAVYDTGD